MPRLPFALAAVSMTLAACSTGAFAPVEQAATGRDAPASKTPGVCAILSINDTYRIEPLPDGTGGMARVRTLRARLQEKYPDLLVLHAGDFLSPSLLSRDYSGAQMVDVLNRLDGSDAFDPRLIVTFGNHELDDDRASVMTARLGESAFRWVSSNIQFAKTAEGVPLIATQKIAEDVIVPCGGMQVGVFGVTIDTKTAPFIAKFHDPIEVARARTRALKERGAEVVVGLTHLAIETDLLLLQTLGADGPDVLAGGHEHVRQTRSADGRGVYKADADARSANLFKITRGPSGPSVEHEWLEVGPKDPPPDPAVEAVVNGWLTKHEATYCQEKVKLPPGCLSETLTMANVDLLADELEIRRFETNLGNFVLDQALAAFTRYGARIAFINSGTLRLNQNVGKGARLTRRVIEELFAYPTRLYLIEITGATLQKVVDRAVTGWTGQGHFLQIAGFAYRHDPETGKATDLTLLGPPPTRVQPTDKIRVVTNGYLLGLYRGQDGYTMIGKADIIEQPGPDMLVGPDLKDLVIEAFKRAGPAGIAPVVEGRICNTWRPGPCLAR